ncbi:hypothetical protein CL622_02870 [archaeon]|nr:hypothetical protein [archaeon]
MKWVALFSQTGSEIHQVSEELGRYPDIILCNKKDDFDSINKGLIDSRKSIVIFTSAKPTVDEYLTYIPEDALVTMHGWLRIVPGEVCQKRNIYNGHPGLITTYPELKGKDPQERAFKAGMEYGGCVIHKAVAEVDAGAILSEATIPIGGLTLDEVYTTLHKVSVNLWIDFLKSKLL